LGFHLDDDCLFGGLNLIVLGVLGIYIGKILIQNKERPLYIIQEQNIHENSLVEFLM